MSRGEAGPLAPPGRGRGAGGRLLASELLLIARRQRNQAGLAVLMAVPVVMAVALSVSSSGPGDGDRPGPDFLSAATGNGYFIALAALGIEMGLFLPLAVSWLAGDAIAGETNLGTLRYLLTVPVGRTRLLAVKYVALLAAAVTGAVMVAFAGLVAGGIAFGVGPVVTLSGTTIGFGPALLRLVVAVLYLAVGLGALAAIGLVVSTLTEQPLGATIGTVAVSTLMWIFDSIPQLDWLHPWLLVHRWPAFGDLLRDPLMLDGIARGLAVDAAYAVVFLTAAWARFGSKDVTG